MSDRLLRNSDSVWDKKQPIEELVDDNISLNRKNYLLRAAVIALSALSIVLYHSNSKNTKALKGVRSENASLREDVSRFQKETTRLVSENERLKAYGDEAYGFVLAIQPHLDENDLGCEDPNCAQCQKMEKENNQKLETYFKATKALNIDLKTLHRLQKGFTKE